MASRLATGIALATLLACTRAAPRVRIELIQQPATLSQTPQYFAAAEPLRADNDSVGLCVYPARGYSRSDRWTILTPQGGEARVVAHAELENGQVVTLSSPSTTGDNLCVHPKVDGPLEAPVRRVRVVASTPIVVTSIVWQSTDP